MEVLQITKTSLFRLVEALLRGKAEVIGLHPTRSHAHRFTSPAVSAIGCKTADLMLTDLKDGTLAVEVLSAQGKKLLKK